MTAASMVRRVLRPEVILGVLLLATYVYFLPRWADWNQNSRLALVLAIVDQGSLSIDAYRGSTGDYALFEGRYYSDKAPGVALLGVPVYAALRPVLQSPPVAAGLDRLAANPAFATTLNPQGTGLARDKVYQAAVLTVLAAVVVAVPSALLGAMLFRFLGSLGASPWWAAAIVLVYGLGTSAFPYAGAFLSHQLVAALLLFAFYLLFRTGRGEWAPGWAFAAGLLLGMAVIAEYPAALAAGALFLYAAWRDRWSAVRVAVGALPPMVALAAYNLAIFRTPLPVGYRYSELFTDVHETGFLSLTYPHVDALWGISFGAFRGLFFLSPVLLLGVVAFVAWWKAREHRAELVVCAWTVAAFFLFYGSSVMWHGGFAVGPRYLVPMLPFLVLPVAALSRLAHRSIGFRLVSAVLAVVSLAGVWAQTLGGQQFPDFTPFPLVDYSLPRLLEGDVARNLGMLIGLSGWPSLAPLIAVTGLLLVVLAASLAGSAPAQLRQRMTETVLVRGGL